MTALAANTRRHFLLGIAVAGGSFSSFAYGEKKEKEEISPAEDLMREHGVLRRILLVYREAIRRIDSKLDFPAEALTGAAGIVRQFIQDYHEKLEEEHLFPRFRRANKLIGLVDTLQQQHAQGHVLTADVLKIVALSGKDAAQKAKLKNSLHSFVTMYEPHAAREDTVLFPAIRRIVSSAEYDKLGDQFEEKEHRLFGEEGFDKKVDQVSEYEKAFGIENLAQFTPAAK
jgi:hemerythrin-like domain-containing protein